jgi:hypothetical protein
VSEPVKTCPHCGAKMVEYKHSISKGLARALAKVVRATRGRSRFEISECGLTYSERENIRKLQYWGLITKAPTNSGKGGEWIITTIGMDFLKGTIKVQKSVWTYRGETIRFEGPHINITEVTDGWKYRPDYAREAEPHQ